MTRKASEKQLGALGETAQREKDAARDKIERAVDDFEAKILVCRAVRQSIDGLPKNHSEIIKHYGLTRSTYYKPHNADLERRFSQAIKSSKEESAVAVQAVNLKEEIKLKEQQLITLAEKNALLENKIEHLEEDLSGKDKLISSLKKKISTLDKRFSIR
jgi:chromosome segregation ATPase